MTPGPLPGQSGRGRCGVETCPCNDGDPCNYEDHGDTKAMHHPDEILAETVECRIFGQPASIPKVVADYITALQAQVTELEGYREGVLIRQWERENGRSWESLQAKVAESAPQWVKA